MSLTYERLVAVYRRSQTPGDVGMSVTAPEAHGYEFQSGKVVTMLKKLKDKFDVR